MLLKAHNVLPSSDVTILPTDLIHLQYSFSPAHMKKILLKAHSIFTYVSYLVLIPTHFYSPENFSGNFPDPPPVFQPLYINPYELDLYVYQSVVAITESLAS
jgi:hypothetical protein